MISFLYVAFSEVSLQHVTHINDNNNNNDDDDDSNDNDHNNNAFQIKMS